MQYYNVCEQYVSHSGVVSEEQSGPALNGWDVEGDCQHKSWTGWIPSLERLFLQHPGPHEEGEGTPNA